MGAMKNLDFIIENISMSPEEYEDNKELINAHLNGNKEFNQLPVKLQTALVQWEDEELELQQPNDHDIQPWEGT